MSHLEHRAAAPATVRCFVLTVSDSRTAETDVSGSAIADLLAESGHAVAGRAIVPDDPARVAQTIRAEAARVQALIATGGTGLASRDTTFEAISALLDKRIDGFGELFRMLSYAEIGAAAMLTRATAGTIGQTAVFSLPGSEHAVRLAMTKLILPELGHIVRELAK